MVDRIPEQFRPIQTAPDRVARIGHLPAIAAGIVYWESIRDRAIEMGHYSVGRMAAVLAESHRTAWAHSAVEGNCSCPLCRCEVASDRN